jgi:surface protein
MEEMFLGCTTFNQDIGNWNVENVETMESMFYGCCEFDQDLSSWKLGISRNMQKMFYGVTLSTENYDKLLIYWASLQVRERVFSAGNIKCSEKGKIAREILKKESYWLIVDGGVVE